MRGRSDENINVVVRTTAPVVKVTAFELFIPSPALPTSDVSDRHRVPSNTERLTLAATDPDILPIPAPTSVTLTDPLPHKLPDLATLTFCCPYESISVFVPARPVLSMIDRVKLLTELPRQRREVSEVHTDDSHELRDNRPAAEVCATPAPVPAIVMLATPVVGTLKVLSTLARAPSKERVRELLLADEPTLTNKRIEPPKLALILPVMDVSDNHLDDSHRVRPTRAR